MADLFDNYIFLIIVGIIVVLVIFLVICLIFSRRKKKENVNEVNEFTSIPELNQLSSSNDVKPFSEQDFNRQLMSQVQGVPIVDNPESGSVPNLGPEIQGQQSVQPLIQNVANNQVSNVMPNLVPEFNASSDNGVSNLGSESDLLLQSQNQNQVVFQNGGQPDIFGPSPVIFNNSSVSSDVDSIDIVDEVQEDIVDVQEDIVDVVEPVSDVVSSNQSDVVDFNSVFGQSSNGSNQ